ncbi:CASP-like protein 4B4 [Musa acuminata AAA Group]|uniref:CASP-like protein 4B4 n=1 Tax=Musa acuminata AAA Group TaxID=214697 RepID=UPI0031D55789
MAADADGDEPTPTAPAADPDLEKAAPGAAAHPSAPAADEGGTVVRTVLARWRREDLLERSILVLRALVLFFSLLAAVIVASNKHGDWRDFDLYQEYRYLLGISLLAFLYSMGQLWRQARRFSTGKDLVPRNYSGIVDFAGDQVTAYLLISALSAAIPLTNRMREGSDNIFTDSSCASISMAFFAFVSSALSALISGFKLSKQTYI